MDQAGNYDATIKPKWVGINGTVEDAVGRWGCECGQCLPVTEAQIKAFLGLPQSAAETVVYDANKEADKQQSMLTNLMTGLQRWNTSSGCDFQPIDSTVPPGNPGLYGHFTDRARKVMQMAKQEAARLNHEYLGTEHVLVGLVKAGDGMAVRVLHNLGVEGTVVLKAVRDLVEAGPDALNCSDGKFLLTPRARSVVLGAHAAAKEMGHGYHGTEHLLLGCLREPEGVAGHVLLRMGVTEDRVKAEVTRMLSEPTKDCEAVKPEDFVELPPTGTDNAGLPPPGAGWSCEASRTAAKPSSLEGISVTQNAKAVLLAVRTGHEASPEELQLQKGLVEGWLMEAGLPHVKVLVAAGFDVAVLE